MKRFFDKWFLSTRIVFNLILISTFATIMAQLFNAVFIQHNYTVFFSGLYEIFIAPPIIPIILLGAALAMLVFTISLDKMIHKNKGDLSSLSPLELQRFHQRVSGIPIVIFGINSIGFLIAPIFTAWVFPYFVGGTYAHDKFILTFFYTIPIGVVCALWQVEKNNAYLVNVKEQLKIQNLQRKSHWYNSYRFKMMILSFATVALVGLLLVDVNHFYLREPQRETFKEIEARYMTQQQRVDLVGEEDYQRLVERQNSVITKWEASAWPEDISIPLSELKSIMLSDVNLMERRAMIESLILFLLSVGIVIRLAIVVNSAHQRELTVLIRRMDELVEEGDLSSRLSVINNNEAGELTSLINRFIARLQTMVGHVAGVSRAVSGSSKSVEAQISSMTSAIGQLQNSSVEVSSNVETQAGFIEQSSEEITAFLTSVSRISDNVTTQATLIEQSSASIAQMSAGIDSVNKTVSQAENISAHLKNAAEEGEKSVMSSVEQMQQLVDLSNDVSTKVKGISKISAQTNMLAMNAAIEAAHAGESGKGFAVVADEVRSLAEMSAGITKEVITIIKRITELILDGAAVAEESGQAFQSILSDIIANTDIIQMISVAVNEQKVGVREVLESSASLVMSSEDIKGIVSNQKHSSESMQQALRQMVESTEKISDATRVQNQQTDQMSGSIKTVVTVSENNVNLAGQLNDLVDDFKV